MIGKKASIRLERNCTHCHADPIACPIDQFAFELERRGVRSVAELFRIARKKRSIQVHETRPTRVSAFRIECSAGVDPAVSFPRDRGTIVVRLTKLRRRIHL